MAMQVRLKFGSVGSGKGQFSSPHGFCLGCDEDIVVADTNNHRIQVRGSYIPLSTSPKISNMTTSLSSRINVVNWS